MRAAELDLDLDVFAGPFDLLMTLVLREELDLAEVALGEIVVAYVEHLDEAGELDLEAATEFLVLIASLLELKSRLLLPRDDEDEIQLGPEEAADELLARMLEYAATATRPRTCVSSSRTGGATCTGWRRCRPSYAGCRSTPPGRPTRRSSSPSRSATCCGRRRRPTPATSGPRSRWSGAWSYCGSCWAARRSSTSTSCSPTRTASPRP